MTPVAPSIAEPGPWSASVLAHIPSCTIPWLIFARHALLMFDGEALEMKMSKLPYAQLDHGLRTGVHSSSRVAETVTAPVYADCVQQEWGVVHRSRCLITSVLGSRWYNGTTATICPCLRSIPRPLGVRGTVHFTVRLGEEAGRSKLASIQVYYVTGELLQCMILHAAVVFSGSSLIVGRLNLSEPPEINFEP